MGGGGQPDRPGTGGEDVSETKPPCWDDGSCPTPVKCYLHGCRRQRVEEGNKIAPAAEAKSP
jgi:hypothetical protein